MNSNNSLTTVYIKMQAKQQLVTKN